jgi:hypothetical protein
MYKEGIHTAIFDCEVRKRSKRLGNTGNRSNRTVPYLVKPRFAYRRYRLLPVVTMLVPS